MPAPSTRTPGSPIFVLCGARSGSTLLRVVLDAHPSISCPAESNLALVLSHLSQAAHNIYSDPQQASVRYEIWARAVADQILGEHARSQDKHRWADKSLVSAKHCDLLQQAFPEAKFICLYRHVADVAASLLEASPWGFSFGLAPYVAASPDNLLAAAFQYWIDHVSLILAHEKRAPSTSYRLRYEDLVSEPAATLARIFDFLGEDEGIELERVGSLLSTFALTGPGDYKLAYTESILPTSVGRGSRLPLHMLPSTTAERANELLAEFGYSPIELQPGGPSAAAPTNLTERRGDDASDQAYLDRHLLVSVASRLKNPTVDYAAVTGIDCIDVDLIDAPHGYRIDLRRHTVARVATEAADPASAEHWRLSVRSRGVLASVVQGRENIGVALRRRDVMLAPPISSSDAVVLANLPMTETIMRAIVALLRDETA